MVVPTLRFFKHTVIPSVTKNNNNNMLYAQVFVVVGVVLLSSLLNNHSIVVEAAGATADNFNLTVLHFNDFHARFEETSVRSGSCRQSDADSGKCYGGLARLYQTVQNVRQSNQHPTILLNGGDMYQGTIWYSMFKWKAMLPFMNKFDFTASALGNHEFDDSPAGLLPFAQGATFPLVCANCDFSEMPEFNNLVKPYHITQVGGRKIGIIGYLTPDTKHIAKAGRMLLRDEIESVRKYARQMKGEGVNIVIALGHSGYTKDKEVAAEIPEVDLVIGGHSHSFLYTGKTVPSIEVPRGPYPTIVKQAKTGKKVLVVQAYAYTKYLGRMDLSIDQDGEIQSFNGQPILLDASHPQNEDMLNDMKDWKKKLGDVEKSVVGETKVLLEAARNRETNLGDFIADAMLDYYQTNNLPDGSKPGFTVSIFNSGGLRASIEVGNVTVSDIMTLLPFGSSHDSFVAPMKVLRQAMEHSAATLSSDGTMGGGAFLQIGGMKCTIDLSQSPGRRIKEITLQHPDEPGLYVTPSDQASVLIISNDYVASGKDGFDMFGEGKTAKYTVGPLDVDILKSYLKKKSPVTQKIDGRIKILLNSIMNDDVINDDSRTRALSTESSAAVLKSYELVTTITTLLLTALFRSSFL